jgi:hypothetical protein
MQLGVYPRSGSMVYDHIDLEYEVKRARKDGIRAGIDIGLSLGSLLTLGVIIIVWLLATS